MIAVIAYIIGILATMSVIGFGIFLIRDGQFVLLESLWSSDNSLLMKVCASPGIFLMIVIIVLLVVVASVYILSWMTDFRE